MSLKSLSQMSLKSLVSMSLRSLVSNESQVSSLRFQGREHQAASRNLRPET